MTKTATKNKEIEYDAEIVSRIVLDGDISKLSPEQKAKYNLQLCQALNLNPLTHPFQLLILNGKQVLYATKNAAEQLRENYNVSVTQIDRKMEAGLCIVTVTVQNGKGRMDGSIGAVPIAGLSGDKLANAIMKAETKAKRRATLSICGLGMLDETEIDTIPGARATVFMPEVNDSLPSLDLPATIDRMRAASDIRELQNISAEATHHALSEDDRAILRTEYEQARDRFKGGE